jgi:hypothetical protein
LEQREWQNIYAWRWGYKNVPRICANLCPALLTRISFPFFAVLTEHGFQDRPFIWEPTFWSINQITWATITDTLQHKGGASFQEIFFKNEARLNIGWFLDIRLLLKWTWLQTKCQINENWNKQ